MTDEAPSAEATDWPQIMALYELLMRISENPVVALTTRDSYQAAARRTTSLPQQRYLQARAARLTDMPAAEE